MSSAADLIVVGTVLEVLPPRWTTVDGQRPTDPCSGASQDYIYTPVRVQVEQMLKGQASETQLLVFVYGGTIGGDRSAIGYPPDPRYTFRQGERAVVMLSPRAPDVATLNGESLHGMLEHYTVLPNGQATDGTRTIPYAQLLNEIAAAQR